VAIPKSDELRVFMLNVGQADAAVIVSPSGEVLVNDAVFPSKMIALLKDLGLTSGDAIAGMILSHPHVDHYSGAGRLIEEFDVRQIVLTDYEHYSGTPGYHAVINSIEKKRIPCVFASGHMGLSLFGSRDGDADRVKIHVLCLWQIHGGARRGCADGELEFL